MNKPNDSKDTISFKHSGNTGDIIYALAGIKKVCEDMQMKAKMFIWIDRPAGYYDSAQPGGTSHPLGDVTMNKYMYKMVKPLLLSQPYVQSVSKYDGQPERGLVDLDTIRFRDIGMPNGNIAHWYGYVFADMFPDTSLQWLDVPGDVPSLSNSIIINRTERYINHNISYAFLRHRKEDLIFVGTQKEYNKAAKEIKGLKYVQFESFLDLARAIKSCKFFVGNQSMCFALAEAMKTPRILEVCVFAPNVIPAGPGPAYAYYSQQAFEYYVEELGERDGTFKIVLDRDWNDAAEKLKASQSFESLPLIQRIPKMHGSTPVPEGVVENTLIDYDRLHNLVAFAKYTEELPGVIAEVGVYKGGSALLLRHNSMKNMYLFDTFEGMPEVKEGVDLHHKGDFADTSLKQVIDLLEFNRSSGLLRESCERPTKFVVGKFPTSLYAASNRWDIVGEKFSLVHIDVDIYQSVKDCLAFFYPAMVKGGIMVLDDVYEPNCPGAKKAFEEFMADKPEKEFNITYSQVAFIKL